jgi:hypothetical protein
VTARSAPLHLLLKRVRLQASACRARVMMQALSLANALFILHALSILGKVQLENKFRSFYSRGCGSAVSEEENELIDRKGART